MNRGSFKLHHDKISDCVTPEHSPALRLQGFQTIEATGKVQAAAKDAQTAAEAICYRLRRQRYASQEC